jgi:threonine/homoserine/homoserine lactone efflux protein
MNEFIKGVILGFSIAAPVGPIGVLCIRKTLQFGRLSGLSSGMGAAIADTVYGIIAAFGLTLVANFLIAAGFWLKLVGGGFLIYLGGKTFLSKPSDHPAKVTHQTLLKDFISTLFLTMTNPMTILSYVAIFAGLGITGAHGSPFLLVLGVFIGSALWWLILSEGVTFFRKKVSQKVMVWINRVAGLIILAFGLIAWLNLFS